MRNLNFSAFLSRVVVLGLAALPILLPAQNSLTNSGAEFSIVSSLPGDQVGGQVAISSSGGWVVWQDNATDGDGLGISARHLGATLSGDLNVFRVNQIGMGDQENPQVVMLKNGGAAFVWQGGKFGFQKIYARFMDAAGIFLSGDILVNTYTNEHQIAPSITCLPNGNVAIVWASYGQDGSMYGVYGRILSSTGSFVTPEFQVNQTTDLNQKSISITALTNGNCVVAWVSEKTLTTSDTNNPSGMFAANVKGRVIGGNGAAVTSEFLLNSGDEICASPYICGVADGGFVAAWSRKDTINASNSWDVIVRGFAATGVPKAAGQIINAVTYGDQYAPVLATTSGSCFVTWTSFGQDGSSEGIYGRLLNTDAAVAGDEIRVNTTTIGRQIQASLASDGAGRYLVNWSSFTGSANGFDLLAQRFSVGAIGLVAPEAPYAYALSESSISVTWPEVAGYAVAFYELYMDNGASPIAVVGNRTTITNLTASSTHSFKLLYQLADGRRSPLSATSVGKTWGLDGNGDGLPDDWQTAYWGKNPALWPVATFDIGCGTVAQAFRSGSNPLDCSTALKSSLTAAVGGMTFSWNTHAGFIYQVQLSHDLHTWEDYGSARFARTTVDAITVDAAQQPNFYRVICLR